jgi:imidazolonepropionase-like amidohydrolase
MVTSVPHIDGALKRMGAASSWSAAVLAIGIALVPDAGLAQLQRPKAFIGARLIDGRGGPPVENATIVVRDGVITAVGTASEVVVPDDSRIFGLAGKTVMPGLIDAHVHIGLSGGGAVDAREYKAIAATKNLRSYIVFGVTTVFDLGGNPFIVGLKEVLASERMIGPRLFGVKNAITSPESHPLGLLKDLRLDKLLGAAHPTVQTVERARYWIDRLAAERVDAIKIFHTRSEPGTARLAANGNRFEAPVLKALVAAAHRKKLRAFVHVAVPDEAREAVLAGADVIAGAIGRSEAGADETFRLMAERGAAYIPTLAQIEAIHAGPADARELEKFRGRVWSVVLDGIVNPNGVVQKRRLAKGVAAASRRHFEIARANLKRAVAAGVRIAMGTGAGNPGVMHGASAPREMELMTQSGMSPMQAIVAATANAAEIIGQGSKLGTIEPDKLADMIVVSGDPLTDISAIRGIELVVRGGYAFDPAGIRID